MRVRWTTPAADDLEASQTHYLEKNPEAARKMAERVVASTKLLLNQPQLGRPGLRPTTREWVVRDTPYILVYRIHEDLVEILHVWHGAQNWRKD